MKLSFMLLLAVSLVIVGCSESKDPSVVESKPPNSAPPVIVASAPTPSLGTWRHSKNGVQLGELRVIPAADYADFELDVTRGSPDYNSGSAAGRMMLKEGRWAYEMKDYGDLCRITFTFSPTQVHVEQVGDWNACGFGYGVLADGDYTLVSHEKPTLQQPEAGNAAQAAGADR